MTNFFNIERSSLGIIAGALAALFLMVVPIQVLASSQIVTHYIESEALKSNLVGLTTRRRVSVYLPDGYEDESKSYPVIYHLHSFFWDDQRMFEDGIVQKRFDEAIERGVIKPFILVAGDFSNSQVGSFYENSAVSGYWLDYITQEMVPAIDNQYRTIEHPNSRGISGEMIGGYGALKLAMMYPDIFSSVYALHPVGTGLGYVPMVKRPDWKIIHQAKSFQEIEQHGNIFSTIFTAMAQAYSPNPNKPPFFADFMTDPTDEGWVVNPVNSETLMSQFLLDRLLPQYAQNMRQLKGIKFDWGRYDSNQDHVLSNQNFSRKLEEYGIEHSAEEYRGNTYDKNWIPHGRVSNDMLPFFNHFLVFDPSAVTK